MKKKKKVHFSSIQHVKVFDKLQPSNDPGQILSEEVSPHKKHKKRIKSPTASSKILSLPSTSQVTTPNSVKKKSPISTPTSYSTSSASASVSASASASVSTSSSSKHPTNTIKTKSPKKLNSSPKTKMKLKKKSPTQKKNDKKM